MCSTPTMAGQLPWQQGSTCMEPSLKMHCLAFAHTFPRVLLLCLNILQALALSKDLLQFTDPERCKSNEYFDTTTLSCLECDRDKQLEPSGDRLRCVCNRYSKMIDFRNGQPVCSFCGRNATATLDGNDCIGCNDTKCRCHRDQLRIDRDFKGTLLTSVLCLSCPRGTYPSFDGLRCIACNNITHRDYHTDCPCPLATHVWVENYCLRKEDHSEWLDVRNTYLVKFKGQIVDSYYLRSELQAAMYFCKRRDRLACEHLSNICALTLYNNGPACELFMQTHTSPVWLFYNKDQTTAVLNGKQITQNYSLANDDDNSVLNFTITAVSLRGDLLSIGKPKLPCGILKNVKFGVNFNKKCRLAVEDLLTANVTFFSPYLMFAENQKVLMHALPVLVKNNNENTDDTSNWQLVRKFFLTDNVSGFKTIPRFASVRIKKANELSVLRYMRSLNILINVRGGQDRGKIYPPVIIVEYSELTYNRTIEDDEVTIDYGVTFVSRENAIDYNTQIAIGVLTGLSLILSGVKTWSNYRRNYTYVPSITLLLWFCVYAIGAAGNAIILCTIGACIYLFVFYKGQTVPYILLPDETTEGNIRIYTIVAFSFKIIEIIGFVYEYWNTSVFLIDWEQPRSVQSAFTYDSPHTSLQKHYSNRFDGSERKIAQTPSEVIAAKRKKTPGKLRGSECSSKSSTPDNYETKFSAICSVSRASLRDANGQDNASISVWRTYFIANQWLKLQSKRKINIVLQAVITLSVLQVSPLNSWCLAVPTLNASEFPEAKPSFALYYAVCTLVYITVYLIQRLISVAFYERYVNDRMQEFVDLCSITNISVFILPFNYYGFYIHGRSVHGYADVDAFTLTENLRKEEDNLCAHRGLVPGTTEQTFVMSLTESFKNIYDELLKGKDTGRNRFLRTNRFSSVNWDEVFKVRCKLQEFLSKYIDHCFKEEDYIIKEQNFLEKLCDVLIVGAKEKSIFFIDNNHTFNQAVLYGNEWLVATFEITVFAFSLAIWADYTVACIFTLLSSAFLIMIKKYNGKRNIANKSLLDGRFLM